MLTYTLRSDSMMTNPAGVSLLPSVSTIPRHIEELLSRVTAAPDPAQQWYWSEEWQAMEREAEEDFRMGRYEAFDTMEEFLASL